MKAKRFTEEQIIAVLKEADAGAKTQGSVSAARDLRADLLQLESQVRLASVSSQSRFSRSAQISS